MRAALAKLATSKNKNQNGASAVLARRQNDITKYHTIAFCFSVNPERDNSLISCFIAFAFYSSQKSNSYSGLLPVLRVAMRSATLRLLNSR